MRATLLLMPVLSMHEARAAASPPLPVPLTYFAADSTTVVAPGSSGASPGPRRHNCPAWSPDGSLIAADRRSFEDDGGRGFEGELIELRIYRADGGGVVATRNLGADGSCISWSPDGTRIAFEQDRTIHTMASDGTDDKVVSSAPCAWDTDPAWTPTGLLFARVVPDRRDLAAGVIDSGCVGEDQTGIWLLRDTTAQMIATPRDAYDTRWHAAEGLFTFSLSSADAASSPLEIWAGTMDGESFRISAQSAGNAFSPTALVERPSPAEPGGASPATAVAPSGRDTAAKPPRPEGTALADVSNRSQGATIDAPLDSAVPDADAISSASRAGAVAVAAIAVVSAATVGVTVLAGARRRRGVVS